MRADEILNELHGAYEYRNAELNTLDDLKKYMSNLGFKPISGGEYSFVFEHKNSGLVMKVYNDPCYDAFIKFCKVQPDNPYLPKFRGNSVRINDRARMVRIEHLTPVPTGYYHANFQMLVSISKEPENMSMWDLTEQQKEIIGTLSDLRENLPVNCRMDMHKDNIMLRGETPVIIDPFAHKEADGWASGVV